MAEPLYRIVDIDRIEENINTVERDTFGVFICKGGNAELSLGDKAYRIERNILFFYTPYTIIRVARRSDDFAGMLLEEDMDVLFTTIAGIPVKERILIRENPCIKVSDDQMDRMEEMIRVIRRRDEMLTTGLDDNATGLITEVVMSLVRAFCFELIEIYFACSPLKDIPQTKEARIYSLFISSVFHNCLNERSVAFYASQQNLSPGHFSTVIKEVSGMTALRWIETVTMTKAKKFLGDHSLSVKEIAIRMHFPDQSSFGRYFKSHEGVSPTEYRNRK